MVDVIVFENNVYIGFVAKCYCGFFMQVQISRELDKKIKQASKALGFEDKKIVERALLFYLDAVKEQLALKREFKEWDKLSDEALVEFEKEL